MKIFSSFIFPYIERGFIFTTTGKGDWIYQIYEDMKDFELPECHSYYESLSENKFKDIIKIKAKNYAFGNFINMKNGHSKMKRLSYDGLKMQEYLYAKNTTIEQKKTIIRWRLHMEDFGENYRGNKEYILYPLCGEHRDSEELCFTSCKVIHQEMNVEGYFHEIFQSNVEVKTTTTLMKIMKIKERMKN